MFKIVRILVALITAEALLLATNQQATGQQSSTASTAKKPTQSNPPAMETMAMPLVAPLFVQDETTDSEVTIVSNFSKALNVTVTLSDPAGNPLTGKTVNMEAYSQKKLKVADLLAEAQSYSATYGSVSVVPERPASVAAQMSIVNRDGASPTDVEEEFAMLMDSKPANYRAVTSGLSAMPVLSIRSMSSNEQKVAITCLAGNGRVHNVDLAIKPNETRLVQACHGNSAKQIERLKDVLQGDSNGEKTFALSVSSSAPSEELAVFGIGVHGSDKTHALSAIPFWNVNTLKSPNAIYAGVPASPNTAASSGPQATKLQVALANFGSAPRTATVLLSSGAGNGNTQKPVGVMRISPNSVMATDLDGISADALAANSLIVQTDGAPGEVISDIQAISAPDDPTPLALTLPWKDQGQVENGGEHPWIVKSGTTSTLVLFNPDPDLKNSSVQLTIHAGANTWTKQISLPASTTMSVSLNDIIQQQQPDDKGKKLPQDSSQGIVTWSTLAKPRIFGKLVQSDEISGISRTYACGSITSICAVVLQSPNPNPVLIGQQTEVDVNSVLGCTGDSPCSCNDGCGSAGSGGSSSWWSDDSNVANLVNSSTFWANYQGNSPGQTFADVSATDGNGCTGSGSVSMSVASCTAPTSETTTFSQWADNDPLFNNSPAIAEWIQVLQPAGAYTGGTVKESDYSPATDGCWFDGSPYAPTYGVAGSSWPVGNVGQWGPDGVGYLDYAEFAYYQTTRAQRGLALPCNVTLFQRLAYLCPGASGAGSAYDDTVLQVTVSGTGLTVTREGQTEARTLIGH